jgi:tetratricopeptide (TPR) repeat protein
VYYGSLYRVKRDFDQAVEYYQKALVIREQYLSIPHHTVAHLHMKFSEIYLNRGQTELAFPQHLKFIQSVCHVITLSYQKHIILLL